VHDRDSRCAELLEFVGPSGHHDDLDPALTPADRGASLDVMLTPRETR
jgi:hypothetical protein